MSPKVPLDSRTARRLVHLALLCWFLAQCGSSVSKLLDRNIGTSERTGHERRFRYPSVTLCKNLRHGTRNLTEAFTDESVPAERDLVQLFHTTEG